MRGCSLGKVCDSIGTLKHLRYFMSSNCFEQFFFLKSIIFNTVCLQMLRLLDYTEAPFSTKDLSNSNLINLRYLEIGQVCFSKDKKITSGLGKIYVGKIHKSVNFSKGHSLLTNIVEISLRFASSLQYLPPMERLPFLKSLDISNLSGLEYIYFVEPLLPEQFFPSLEKLIESLLKVVVS